MLLVPLVPMVGCAEPGGAGTCYLDAHCTASICVEGRCLSTIEAEEDSDAVDDTIRLDVGGGPTPEIPTSCAEARSVRTSAGCEFWAADLPNAWLPSEPYGHDTAAAQQFAVVVANVSDAQPATVSVYSGNENKPLETRTIGPLRAATLELPEQSLDPTRNDGGRAYRIESDVPITAYQFQPLDNLVPVYSNDATSLLPAHVLETDYMAMTSDAQSIAMYPDGFERVVYSAGAFVTVVATENDTAVTFHPTTELAPGAWQGVVLHRGQTFTILSDVHGKDTVVGDPWGNLSGTRVIADKPVALFSGNVVASEPRGTTECCLDHVEHQMLPLAAWGHRYVVAPPPHPDTLAEDAPAVYRITAAFDGTVLEYGGSTPDGAPTTLEGGQTAVFVSTTPLVVSSDPEHPFAVAQFVTNSGVVGSKRGDPAMIALPAMEQLQSRYVFITPYGYEAQAVNIVAPEGATVSVDGQTVSSFRSVSGSTYARARVEVAPGAHTVVADAPVEIIVYGYDDYVSYGYSGGSAVDRISIPPPVP